VHYFYGGRLTVAGQEQVCLPTAPTEEQGGEDWQ
jgi:hypothetical protein